MSPLARFETFNLFGAAIGAPLPGSNHAKVCLRYKVYSNEMVSKNAF